MPAPCLAGAHAAIPAGPASPALCLLSFPPRASPDCDGRERWAPATPLHLFQMTLAGQEHSRPRQRGAEPACVPAAGRGAGPRRAPPATARLVRHRPSAHWAHGVGAPAGRSPPCTRPLADHKRKGKRPGKTGPGAVTGSYLRAPPTLAPRGRGASPPPPTLLRTAISLRTHNPVPLQRGLG